MATPITQPSAADVEHSVPPETSGNAISIGRNMARAMFLARGNHSEIHLSEVQLAALLALAADKAITLYGRGR